VHAVEIADGDHAALQFGRYVLGAFDEMPGHAFRTPEGLASGGGSSSIL
jgi:hypothetical protein